MAADFGSASLDLNDFLLMPLSFHVANRSHAVLQQGRPLLIRGKASPGATLHVSFADETLVVRSDGAGRWRAEFPPRPAGGACGAAPAGCCARAGPSAAASETVAIAGLSHLRIHRSVLTVPPSAVM